MEAKEVKFYDPINDFHFKKDIGSKFKIEKKGPKNLDEGGEEGNLISFQVENSDFYYELITNKLSSKRVPSDLTIRPWWKNWELEYGCKYF